MIYTRRCVFSYCDVIPRWDVGIPTTPTDVFILIRNKTLRAVGLIGITFNTYFLQIMHFFTLNTVPW